MRKNVLAAYCMRVALVLAYAGSVLFLAACSGPWSSSLQATPTPQYAGGEPVLAQLQRLYRLAPSLASSMPKPISWSLAGYDGANTAAMEATALRGNIRWFFQTTGPVLSSPVVAGNLVLVNGGDGMLYALNRQRGMLQWRIAVGDALVAGTAAVADGIVYVAAQSHGFMALRLSDGSLLWQVDTRLPVRAAPQVVGSVLLVLAGANDLLCLDKTSGAEYWDFKSEDVLADFWPSQGQPAVSTLDGGLVFVALGASTEFNALHMQTGRKAWERTMDSRMVGAPVYDAADGLVFVATWAGSLYAMAARTGQLKWHLALAHAGLPGMGLGAGPALAGGRLFLATYQGQVKAIDVQHGTVIWSDRIGGVFLSAPIVRLAQQQAADVFVTNQTGTLLALYAKTGFPEWQVYLGELRSSPTLAQDELLVGAVSAHGLFALN